MSEPRPRRSRSHIATTCLRDPSAAADGRPRPPPPRSPASHSPPPRVSARRLPSAAAGRPASASTSPPCATIPRAATTGPASRGGRKERAEARREKFAFFETQASRSSTASSLRRGRREDRAVLDACGITHVINCNAFVIPNYHERPPTSRRRRASRLAAAVQDAAPGCPRRGRRVGALHRFDFIRDCVDSAAASSCTAPGRQQERLGGRRLPMGGTTRRTSARSRG